MWLHRRWRHCAGRHRIVAASVARVMRALIHPDDFRGDAASGQVFCWPDDFGES
jgi:hypothetical protein